MLSVGPLGRAKDPSRLLQACALLRRAIPDRQLVCAGDSRNPDYAAAVEQLRRKLGLRECVHLLGAVPDAYRLMAGADVTIAGVIVGRVEKVTLTDNDEATLTLRINDGVKITTDAIAAVRTKGIIGDRYVRNSQGADEEYLQAGDEIEETESALNLEDLIGKYIFSGDGK